MGRRKKEVLRLKVGAIYRVDRRRTTFSLVKKILSRQDSKNWQEGNIAFIDIQQPPVDTTIMVVNHSTLFGTEYVKVFVSSTAGQHELGYLNLPEFLSLVCGTVLWTTPPSSTPTPTT
jgi:hypothetical protein